MLEQKISIEEGSEQSVKLALTLRKLLFEEMGVEKTSLLDNVEKVLEEYYLQEYKSDRIKHFIAYNEENTPIAIAGAILKTDFPYFTFKPGVYGWIIDVYTLPEYRGNKLATRLLELTNKWLIGKGIYEVKLIASGEDAKRLYEKIGFKPTWEMNMNLTDNKTYNEIIGNRG
jgi:GNAT superfamily N-acetyltransferase